MMFLKQEVDSQFYVSDLRKISYLLEHIEGFNKMMVVDLEIDEKYSNKESKVKARIFKSEDRISIESFVKQSPIEIKLLANQFHLYAELMLFLIENFENSQFNSKAYIEGFIQREISNGEWIQLMERIAKIKYFLRLLNITILFI